MIDHGVFQGLKELRFEKLGAAAHRSWSVARGGAESGPYRSLGLPATRGGQRISRTGLRNAGTCDLLRVMLPDAAYLWDPDCARIR